MQSTFNYADGSPNEAPWWMVGFGWLDDHFPCPVCGFPSLEFVYTATPLPNGHLSMAIPCGLISSQADTVAPDRDLALSCIHARRAWFSLRRKNS